MSKHCENCTTIELQPSPYRLSELPLMLFLLRPYTCEHCFGRYYRFFL